MEIHRIVRCDVEEGGHIMSEIGVRGIDLFKIAGEGVPTFFPPKIPAKLFLSGAEVGKGAIQARQ
jgi:hypothetical protein